MMHPRFRILLLAAPLALSACSTVGSHGQRSGAGPVEAKLGVVAAACSDVDVVFFGEVHSSDACHEQQRLLLEALREERQDIVISMEMFERDVQGELDAYLKGELDEAEFRTRSRAWKNWHHYKPVVQIAAKHGLPVLAANAPKELVRQVSRPGTGGLSGLKGKAHVARDIRAPQQGAYFDAFVRVMEEHMGTASREAMVRMYEAQCVRDETMAETIADYLEEAHAAGRRPLVYHLCGGFHSARRLGTVSRLLRRMPDLRVKVITTSEIEKPEYRTDGQDFQLFVAKPVAQPKKKEEPAEEPDPNARPGLGFMPAYESSAEGCAVQMVAEGSAAEKAGIKAGDVIVRLAGEDIEDVRAYSDVLGGLRIGEKVEVTLLRGGKRMKLSVVVGESKR